MKNLEGLLGNPMFNAGMGLLSANQMSHTPPNYIDSVMRNLHMGAQYKQNQQFMNQRQQQYDMQMQQAKRQQQAHQQAQQQAQLQQQRLQAFRGQLPPDQQAIFDADQANYIKNYQSQQMATPEAPATGMIKDPNTGQWVMSPDYERFQDEKATLGKSENNMILTNNGNQIQSPIDAFTTGVIPQYNERASTAYQREQEAAMGLDILKSRIAAGDDTGKWAPMQTEMAAYLGIDPEDVARAQLFDVKMGDKVMSRISQTKGSVSEREMSYFNKISPGSDKEPFTNYALLEIDRRAAVREQDKLNYIEPFLKEKGNLLGFDQWYMKNHDPFGEFSVDEMKASFDEFSGGGNQPQINENDPMGLR